ncbi:dTDP-4-amino-4,6-dideoxygalactose transaminase [bioreactor metagenome]|uniref:dTDP-4-amino-4,6-dideoxygalactose transaminase n=1 Tax=bioreactor metagenome TaxID=1076179 RepID=A0A645CS50_9ZZZZ
MERVPFNVPPYLGIEQTYLSQVIDSRKLCGDGCMTKACDKRIEEMTGVKRSLLTTSGSSALDMAAILSAVGPGDEVIMPSFTFSSTANAFALRGATIVFVDIRPDTMNIDETKIERAITPATRVIVPMHYAGVSCEMDAILEIARRHRLLVVEDAAQGVMSAYKGRALGSIGQMGCFSFHETKNYSMGEGGALLFSDASYIERAEIVREKGTDRSRFLRGQVDKYTWTDIGSSFLPSELNAAYLLAQLEHAQLIFDDRMRSWNQYHAAFAELEAHGRVERPVVPEGCEQNAHMYYLKAKDITERTELIHFLSESANVGAVFHYIPLHSAPAGLKYGRFEGEDVYTTKESERLLRLPMFYGLAAAQVDRVVSAVYDFYAKH